MCTIIVTIRSVLWAVMTIVGTLMILVALFTNRWLHGREHAIFQKDSLLDSISNIGRNAKNFVEDRAGLENLLDKNLGLFLDCKEIAGDAVFDGECIPDLEKLLSDKGLFSKNDQDYPHAWKGGILCFVIGLGIMVLTILFSLLTPCCRSCVCCSIFTLCGSLQSFAAVLFTLGLLSFPAGWASQRVTAACGHSNAFVLGDCQIGGAFWMAVAGTICTYLASTLAIFAYKSTTSSKAMNRRQVGDRFICVP